MHPVGAGTAKIGTRHPTRDHLLFDDAEDGAALPVHISMLTRSPKCKWRAPAGLGSQHPLLHQTGKAAAGVGVETVPDPISARP
jgi:hypothetical protein